MSLSQVEDRPADHGAHDGLWSARHRGLTVGLVLTITLVAFEALAVSTVMPDVAAEFGRDGENLYGWAFTAFFLGTLIGIVAIGGMVQTFGVPPTTVGTGIVMYSLAVAGFVMLGAKLVQRFGSTRVFRIVVALFGVAQVLMTFSPVATVMLVAQLLAGLAAAVIVPRWSR